MICVPFGADSGGFGAVRSRNPLKRDRISGAIFSQTVQVGSLGEAASELHRLHQYLRRGHIRCNEADILPNRLGA